MHILGHAGNKMTKDSAAGLGSPNDPHSPDSGSGPIPVGAVSVAGSVCCGRPLALSHRLNMAARKHAAYS